MFDIPKTFIQTMTDIHGEAGLAWLDRLPQLLMEYAQRWSLTLLTPFSNLTYNYVVAGTQLDGSAIVLKACYPDDAFVREARALELYAGRGCAHLLMVNYDQGLLLLECLKPGHTLRTVRDDQAAMTIAATVLKQLWRPVPAEHPFASVAELATDVQKMRICFHEASGPFPPELLAEAESLLHDLCLSMTETVVLHGDFHHDNILSAHRAPWLAIDPKGLIGEPAYDTAALLRNPRLELSQAAQLERVLAYRIDILAEQLGIERARIRGWGLIQTLLSAFWTYEDHAYIDDFTLTCARHLAAITV